MSATKKRILLSYLLVLVLVGLFSPRIYTLVWHLRHGGTVIFGGKELLVPARWVASPAEDRHVDFVKYPALFWDVYRPTSGFVIGPTPSAQNAEDLYKSWVALNWTRYGSSDGVVRGPFPLGTVASEVVCMTSIPKSSHDLGEASCLLFGRTWMAQFTGYQEDVETFFNVVRSATSAHLSTTGQ